MGAAVRFRTSQRGDPVAAGGWAMSRHRESRRDRLIARRGARPGMEPVERRELLATFTVISSLDGPQDQGTLRQAITLANALPGKDDIVFQIDPASPKTIFLRSALPTITDPVRINGRTQPGFTNRPVVFLSGEFLFSGEAGLTVSAVDTEIDALSISSMPGPGIRLSGFGGGRYEGNYLGIDSTGSSAAVGNGDGIEVLSSSDNTIGGTSPLARNVIGNNSGPGVVVPFSNLPSLRNVILGNYVGTGPDGVTTAPNAAGIHLTQATATTLGGTAAGAGNVISGNFLSGVILEGGTGGTTIVGNRIGVDATASTDVPNQGDGISILSSPDNTIGGTASGARNIIAANTGNGISIQSSGSTGNRILGNLIGLSDNPAVSGNLLNGVGIFDASGNRVGDATPLAGTGAGNVISGNARSGVSISGSDSPSDNNEVYGNLIGARPDGITARANGTGGVSIGSRTSANQIGGPLTGLGNAIVAGPYGVAVVGSSAVRNAVRGNLIGVTAQSTNGPGNGIGIDVIDAPDTIIGDPAAAAGNVIARNGTGIRILGSNASGIVIQNNRIGTALDGVTPLGNDGVGVLVLNGASSILVGGDRLDQGNVIAYNLIGVWVQGNARLPDPQSVTVRLNSIFANTGLGIDLGPAGRTPNDTLDPDPGPNLLQNFPIIDSAEYDGTFLTILGHINTLPGRSFLIDLYRGAADAANIGQGRFYLGTARVTTDATTGDASFRLVVPSGPPSGIVTGTATSIGVTSDTSEFSDAVAVNILRYDVLNTNDAGFGSLRQAILNANKAFGQQTITFAIPTSAACSVIQPLTPLPAITDSVIVDARTQPGYAGTPVVEVDGSRVNPQQPANGLVLLAGNTAVFGLSIHGFELAGLAVVGVNNVVLQSDYVGLDCSGQNAPGNLGGGAVFVNSSNNLIGGETAAERNVVSGNGGPGGIVLIGSSSQNLILGNRIGTNAGGGGALGNTAGIRLAGASANRIGAGVGLGVAPNVISGNQIGVLLTNGATGNQVAGNWIGTNPSGQAAVANSEDGIAVVASPGNTIGAAGAAPANLISGNGISGVRISGSASQGNQIVGNWIGLDASGAQALGNGADGVFLDGAAWNTVGMAPGLGNVVAGNGQVNIQVFGAGATGNAITGNRIGLDAFGRLLTPAPRTAVGVFVNDAPSTRVQDNTVGGHEVGVELYLAGARGNVVQNNRIGTNSAGDARRPNDTGIFIFGAPDNTISGNVVSGNGTFGVRLSGPTASGNRVLGNRIGTDASGQQRLGNAQDGVFVQAPANTIAQNLISANGSTGVQLFGSLAAGNMLESNLIGTDVTGSSPLGNRLDGVYANNAPSNLLSGNVISGNGSVGAQFFGAGVGGNALSGNRIGTNAAGTVVPGLGNNYGVFLNTRAPVTIARDNVIRGNRLGNVVLSPELLPAGITDVRLLTSADQVTGIVVAYSRPMNEASVENVTNYRLLRVASRRSPLGQPVPLLSATYEPNSRTVVLVPVVAVGADQLLRLTIIGRPPGGVRDSDGGFLDGSGTGRRGTNFTVVLGPGSSAANARRLQ